MTGELVPPELRESLSYAMIWLAADMREKFDLRVSIVDEPTDDAGGSVEGLAGSVTTVLLQVVRELLLNVVKHAGVGTAEVVIARTRAGVQLSVSDGGRGFAGGIDSVRGFGLHHVEERLASVGGQIAIESSPGSGTRVELSVPHSRGASR
jgi:signal transduction histidine kinase